MRIRLFAFWMLAACAVPAWAQVSFSVAAPGVSIGINVPVYPEFVRVPGYPVYYAPRLNANYFFYDGLYWVFDRDLWYASTWYNGPWSNVAPAVVPAYVLRIPVRYYRAPPPYFRGWHPDAPPQWGVRWGREWEAGRAGWDRWNRNAMPAPAPLPRYQAPYSGNRYPRGAEQQALHNQHYGYQIQDGEMRKHHTPQGYTGAPPRSGPQGGPIITGPSVPGTGKREPGQDG